MEVSPLLFSNGRYLRVARYRVHFRVRARAFHLKRRRVSRRRSPSIIASETRGDPREIAAKTAPGTLTATMKLRAATPEADGVPATGQVGRMSGIVIYEENDLMRALLREWLSEAGYRVRAGSRCGVQSGGPADLVIVSVYMPKHAGAQLVRETQAAHPGTPLIAISGQFRSGLSANGATAQSLGVQQVIAKPLTRTALLEAVRAIIGAAN
jgi:CheY-like chemotaxis protein